MLQMLVIKPIYVHIIYNNAYDELERNLPEGTATISATVVNPSVVQYDIDIIWALRESLRGEDDEDTKTQSWSMRL